MQVFRFRHRSNFLGRIQPIDIGWKRRRSFVGALVDVQSISSNIDASCLWLLWIVLFFCFAVWQCHTVSEFFHVALHIEETRKIFAAGRVEKDDKDTYRLRFAGPDKGNAKRCPIPPSIQWRSTWTAIYYPIFGARVATRAREARHRWPRCSCCHFLLVVPTTPNVQLLLSLSLLMTLLAR